MADRIFVGNGKRKDLQYGPVFEITVDVDSLIREYGNHGFVTQQGKRKIRLKVSGRREPDQYRNDQLVEVDTWHPAGYVPPGPVGISDTVTEPQGKAPEPFSGYNPAASGSQSFEDDVPF